MKRLAGYSLAFTFGLAGFSACDVEVEDPDFREDVDVDVDVDDATDIEFELELELVAESALENQAAFPPDEAPTCSETTNNNCTCHGNICSINPAGSQISCATTLPGGGAAVIICVDDNAGGCSCGTAVLD